MGTRVFERGLAISVGLALLSACSVFRRIGGNDTVSLQNADVKAMSVDLRRQHKTICPREPVQMAIFAEVVLEGDKQPKPVETYAGHADANKNDRLDFVEFAFHSEQGQFDRDGWFSPNPDLRVSAGKEFEIRSVFRRRPDKFSFTTSYKPDYACIKSAGGGGEAGSQGAPGGAGARGRDGAFGSSTAAGGAGGDGAPGMAGGAGGDGIPGPKLLVAATLVKTPFYERLIAITISGDRQDFLLVPEGQTITILATGGEGGSGGPGGPGGSGGTGGGGNPAGGGGRGAAGGSGGQGGAGGAGGAIEFVYDARFSEIARQVRLEASGGAAGAGGPGGPAGRGGAGGSGQTPSGSSGVMPPTVPRGPDGTTGASGSQGPSGRAGTAGRATARAGDVRDRFSGGPEITPL